MRAPEQRGFTLLEILVALAILAIALTAASRAVGLSIVNASQLRLVVMADWVAQNRLAYHRINGTWPGIGDYTGTESQGGVDFAWQETISGTPHPMFRRVELRVIDPADDKHVLRTLVGYVVQPK